MHFTILLDHVNTLDTEQPKIGKKCLHTTSMLNFITSSIKALRSKQFPNGDMDL